jgi:hypothetical protein
LLSGLGLHCREELINVFMGVTYNQEAEDDLLEHIKCCEQAEESKDISVLVLGIAIISLHIEGVWLWRAWGI